MLLFFFFWHYTNHALKLLVTSEPDRFICSGGCAWKSVGVTGTGGRAFPSMGWPLLWETEKLMVSKEIRFACQGVWKTGRCLDCKCAVAHAVWDATRALPRLLSSAKSRQPHVEVAGTSCTVHALLEDTKPVVILVMLWHCAPQPGRCDSPFSFTLGA